MRLFIGFLVALFVAGTAWAETGKIVVTGRGVVEVVPDMAVLTLGVTHQAKEASVAVSEVATKSGDILNRLTAMGIAARDVQTSNLSLFPVHGRYDSGAHPKIEAYRASNTVTVRVRDLPVLGEVLTRVVQEGANEFSGLQFTLQEPRQAQDAARQAAVKDARAKAALYAEAAGVALGDIVELSEGGASMPRPVPMMRAEMASDVAMPVAEGELSIGAEVTVVFSIAQ